MMLNQTLDPVKVKGIKPNLKRSVRHIKRPILHYLSGPPRVSQSGVELENFFECGFMASDDAYGSHKTYGKVRLKFGPL